MVAILHRVKNDGNHFVSCENMRPFSHDNQIATIRFLGYLMLTSLSSYPYTYVRECTVTCTDQYTLLKKKKCVTATTVTRLRFDNNELARMLMTWSNNTIVITSAVVVQ